MKKTKEGRVILYEDKNVRITKLLHRCPANNYQFAVWKKLTPVGPWCYKGTVTDWEPDK